ncbi:MAG TPA: TIGR00282 family metallophosphoesterase [Gammaproteobacteria bacterium]|nr:TIGR00282 family metallophosphoesterase [Gammaproteobacteria bacterium]
MRILFVGDVMGSAGRAALETYLPQLKTELRADIAIVNGENAANGRGITEDICRQFYAWGVDCITTGNHVWDCGDIRSYIARDPRLLRPANYPRGTPGKCLYIHRFPDGRRIAVINLLARLFMDPLDDPFRAMESLLAEHCLEEDFDAIFVDFHGEATSEKMAFAHCFDGRVSAVVGTHTHVPTADAHVLPGGTAYMSDAGMTGDYDSVIGMRKDLSIQRFVNSSSGDTFVPATGNTTLCGALVVSDDESGHATAIQPVRIGNTLPPALPDI